MNKAIKFLNRGAKLGGEARTGVSLHCHTLHSKEILDFVPYYAERIPGVSHLWRRMTEDRKAKNIPLPDFKKGYWTPPLCASEVFASERRSMHAMGIEAIVSITDHDSINGPLELKRPDAPISLEWTVPYQNAFFHIGVHNLPPERAEAVTADLLAYTHAEREPDDARLRELFALLNEIRDVLVVLNHPIWDIEMIGQAEHERALRHFLNDHLSSLHALEVNGFRSWSENQAVIHLAETVGLPIISGGDRHCCQKNVMINYTDAPTFSEFVDEIRVGKYSRIAIMPEYSVPLPSRQLRSMAEVLGTYHSFPIDRRYWTDRVFLGYPGQSELSTLTELWGGRRPFWTHLLFGALAMLSHPMMRPIISATVGDHDIGRSEAPAAAAAQSPIGRTPIVAEQ